MSARIEPDCALSASIASGDDAKRTSGLVINRISAQKPRREITLEVGQRDIRIRRSYRLTGKPRLGGGIRSNVIKFTNASKMDQKDVPAKFENVGRFWGVWGKPAISEDIHVPQSVGKHLVRTICKAHIKARRDWTSHNRFRDNGRAGFIAWETSMVVRRMLDDFMEDGVLHPS